MDEILAELIDKGSQIGILLGQVTLLGVFVYGSVRGIEWQLDKTMYPSPRRKMIKRLLSWLLGSVYGLVSYGIGLLHLAVEPEHAAWGWIAAVVYGFGGTALAWWKNASKNKKDAVASRLPR